ncbi:MAG: bifunctional riboflavin kinase/FAD synthetase [Actinobacteria bacterium]|nr:MAG: bifunctional riboflavin kinase/FAD synthetase [Actinomycetota bacterium]TMK96318.1 MAG: bifunctional riboflavin kinase/FAD synthetase [Actinomycetota bacterium]
MELARGIASLPLSVGPTAVTIGFFDGVHRGHQAVIHRTVEVANDRGLTPVALTFDRHPRETLTPGNVPPLLTSMDRKAALIQQLGVEVLTVLEFTEELSRWPPEDFVARILVDGLKAGHAVVGSNFTFGHKAAGTLAMLSDLGEGHGFSVEGVGLLKIDGRPVSSSSIRAALAEGDLDWPTQGLGRRFAVDGTVVKGAGRGREMGFPTANLSVPPGMLLPAQGVYAGKALLEDGSFLAAINVGTNPTFGGEPLRVEAFLLEFDRDIQGEPIAIEFWDRLRDEVPFASAEELARQIGEDVDRTRELLHTS